MGDYSNIGDGVVLMFKALVVAGIVSAVVGTAGWGYVAWLHFADQTCVCEEAPDAD